MGRRGGVIKILIDVDMFNDVISKIKCIVIIILDRLRLSSTSHCYFLMFDDIHFDGACGE